MKLTRHLLLSVGDDDPRAARVDGAGAWWSLESASAAHELARELLSQDDTRRVLLDKGPCVHARGRWQGPVVERMRRVGLTPEQGCCVIADEVFQDLAVRGRGEDASRMWDEPSRRDYWRTCEHELLTPYNRSWRARTNVSPPGRALIGREDVLDTLEVLAREESRRVTLLHGVVGVGKSAALGALLAGALSRDGALAVWHAKARGVRSVARLASHLSQPWRLTLRGGPAIWRAQLTVALQDDPGEVWVALEDIDELDDEARSWLAQLVTATPDVRWWLTARGRAWADADSLVELQPLSAEAISEILMERADSSALSDPHVFARILSWAEACKGHPLTAHLVSSTPGWWLDTPTRGAGSPLQLEDLASSNLNEEQRQLLGAFSRFAGAAAWPEAVEWIARALGLAEPTARRALERARSGGWLEVDHDGALRIPGALQALAPARAEDDEPWRQMTFTWLDQWLALLDTPGEHGAMVRWRRHATDLERTLQDALHASHAIAIDKVVHAYPLFEKARLSFDYADLIARARALSSALDHDRWDPSLTFAEVVVLDAELTESAETAALITRCIDHGASAYDEQIWWELRLRQARLAEETSASSSQLAPMFEALYLEVPEDRFPSHSIWAASLAAQAQCSSDPKRARELALWAVERAEALGGSGPLQLAYLALHRHHIHARNITEARAAAIEGLSHMSQGSSPMPMIMMIASLGYAELHAGDAGAARAAFASARDLSVHAGQEFARTNCTYLLALAHASTLDWVPARLHLEQTLGWNQDSGNVWNIHQCKAWLGACLACQGSLDRGRALLIEASRFFTEHEEDEMRHTVSILTLMTEVAEHGWLTPDVGRLRATWERALETPEDTRQQPSWGTLELAHERALVVVSERGERVLIQCDTERARVRIDGGELIDLRRSHTVRAVLHVLLDELELHPGEPIEPMTLFERAWPGQTVEPRAALMRLYVTINKLRKIGFEDLIETLSEGYRMRPRVRAEVTAEGL